MMNDLLVVEGTEGKGKEVPTGPEEGNQSPLRWGGGRDCGVRNVEGLGPRESQIPGWTRYLGRTSGAWGQPGGFSAHGGLECECPVPEGGQEGFIVQRGLDLKCPGPGRDQEGSVPMGD